MTSALACILAFILSLGLGRLAIGAAARLRFMDDPGERKIQERPVPLLGGAAIFLGTLAGTLWITREGGPSLLDLAEPLSRWLLAGAFLLVIGLVDDRRGLGPRIRLAAQVLAALLFWPELTSWIRPAWFGLPLGLFWIVGLTNSLNFLDNMDGASASTGLLASLPIGAALLLAGEGAIAQGLWPLAAALAGFLWWNRPAARLYMGDAGSTFLGLSLAVFTLLLVGRGGVDPWLAPLFLAVPIYDTCSVVWIRWREGRPPWVGDRRHVTHRMVARGRSVGGTLVVLALWTLAAGGLALLWSGVSGFYGLAGGIVAAALLFRWERVRELAGEARSS